MQRSEQVTAKKLLAVSVAIIAVLFVIIVLLIMRHQKLRRTTATTAALPILAEQDNKALSHLRAFGTILEDYGWDVHWNPPIRYEQKGTVHLLRGSLHHEFTDTEGAPVRLGVDALTFAEEASLPDETAFPLEKWRDLHPLRAFTDSDSFPFEVKRAGRTFFVFYKYQGQLPPDLPNQLEVFITGDSRQRGDFRRELAEAHQREKDARKALSMLQEALSKAALYEGRPDGKPGWRTKHALQRFLRQQGFYEGDIDGVFGNGTFNALNAFRAQAGLEPSKAINLDLAQAVVKALAAPPATSNTVEEATTGS